MAMVERRDGEDIGVGSNVALESMHLMPYFSGESMNQSVCHMSPKAILVHVTPATGT